MFKPEFFGYQSYDPDMIVVSKPKSIHKIQDPEVIDVSADEQDGFIMFFQDGEFETIDTNRLIEELEGFEFFFNIFDGNCFTNEGN